MSQQRPRSNRPSMPMPTNGTLGAVVAVVALLLGFLILHSVNGSGSSGSVGNGGNGGNGNSTATTVTATTDAGATATTVNFNVKGFTIQVANASGVALSAGTMTTNLQHAGYVVQPALNTSPGYAKRAKTGVFYLAGCEAAAQNVSAILGGNVEVGAMPQPVPLETANLKDACVLILLGTDLAGKPLQGLIGSGNGAAATTTLPVGAATTTTAG